MTAIRQYILSVLCAGILCGIAQTLFPKSSVRAMIKLITGLIITVVVISPILQGGSFSLDLYMDNIAADGDQVIAEGEKAAMQAVSERIKKRGEAYILEKAAQFGAAITVDMELDASIPPVPKGITISGNVSPYAKKQISASLRDDLGIPEDDQIWIS